MTCQVIILAPVPANLNILGTACMSSTLRSFVWSTLATLIMAHTLVLCSCMQESALVASMAAMSPSRTVWNTLWGEGWEGPPLMEVPHHMLPQQPLELYDELIQGRSPHVRIQGGTS